MRRLFLCSRGAPARARLIRAVPTRSIQLQTVQIRHVASARASRRSPDASDARAAETAAPSAATFIFLIKTHLYAENHEKALETVEAFEASGLDMTSSRAAKYLCNVYSYHYQWDKVLSCLRNSVNAGVDVSEHRSRMLNSILNSDDENALDVLEALIALFPVTTSNTIPPVIFKAIMALVDANRVQAARALFAQVARSSSPPPPICWSICAALVRRYPKEVIQQFGTYQYLLEHVNWNRPKSHVPVLVAASLICKNDIKEAAALLRRAQESNPTGISLPMVIKFSFPVLIELSIKNGSISLQTIADLLLRDKLFPELSPVFHFGLLRTSAHVISKVSNTMKTSHFANIYLTTLTSLDASRAAQRFVLNCKFWLWGITVRSSVFKEKFHFLLDRNEANLLTFYIALRIYQSSRRPYRIVELLTTLVQKLSEAGQFSEPPSADDLGNFIESTADILVLLDGDDKRQQLLQLLQQLYVKFKVLRSSHANSVIPPRAICTVVSCSIGPNGTVEDFLVEWGFWVQHGMIPLTELNLNGMLVALLKLQHIKHALHLAIAALEQPISVLPLSQKFENFMRSKFLSFNTTQEENAEEDMEEDAEENDNAASVPLSAKQRKELLHLLNLRLKQSN